MHLAKVQYKNRILQKSSLGYAKVFSRMTPSDLTLSARPSVVDEAGADSLILKPERVIALPQGTNNSCWADASLVALRMQGVGRLIGDTVKLTPEPTKMHVKATLESLADDWQNLTIAELQRRRDNILDLFAKHYERTPGYMSSLSEFFVEFAHMLPSLSCSIASAKPCPNQKCRHRNVQLPSLETSPDNNICSVVDVFTPADSSTARPTVLALVQQFFQPRKIIRHRSGTVTDCEKCSQSLPTIDQRVIVDRAPHILSVDCPVGSAQNYPEVAKPHNLELLRPMELSYENLKGEKRTVTYMLCSVIHLVGAAHWVVSSRVKLGDEQDPSWITCNGLASKTVAPCTPQDVTRVILQRRVQRFMFKRIYDVQVNKQGHTILA